ncbi:MAG: fatty acid desaturase CarF family protein, partial [Myxococcota bacterium]
MSNHPSNEYGTSYGYSRLHRRIEWSAIIAFALLNAGLVSLTALRIQEAPLWGSVTAVVFFVLSWLAADWVGGFVHWAADNYGEESWPLIGHGLIRPFREH